MSLRIRNAAVPLLVFLASGCLALNDRAPESEAPDASQPGEVLPGSDARHDAGITVGSNTPALDSETLIEGVEPTGPAARGEVPTLVDTPPADDVAAAPIGVELKPGESCPSGMALVEGQYCPVVRHDCKRWLEDPEKFQYARCAEYEPKATCLGQREHRRFCIDVDEYTRPGDALPAGEESWTAAKKTCEAQGKRLCQESEWQFACEGEEMQPYPYGWVRDNTACNFEQPDLYEADGGLRDLREPSSARPRCVSPFGVRNMVGNIDEWTVRDGIVYPHRSALKGGWWLSGRNRCRAATTAHDEVYHGPQTGFRCCANAR